MDVVSEAVLGVYYASWFRLCFVKHNASMNSAPNPRTPIDDVLAVLVVALW
jgi:hypothetical protein